MEEKLIIIEVSRGEKMSQVQKYESINGALIQLPVNMEVKSDLRPNARMKVSKYIYKQKKMLTQCNTHVS